MRNLLMALAFACTASALAMFGGSPQALGATGVKAPVFTAYQLWPRQTAAPLSMTLGPDNDLWIAEGLISYPNPSPPPALFRLDQHGNIKQFNIGGAQQYVPFQIVSFLGALWFPAIGNSQSAIGRMTPNGKLTYIPTSVDINGGIAGGPDGNLWLTVAGACTGVVRTTPQGVTTCFDLTHLGGPTAYPYQIALGPDGHFWVSDGDQAKSLIYRVAVDGTAVVFPDPSGRGQFGKIVAGRDGNLYATQCAYDGCVTSPGMLARISTSGAVTDFSFTAGPKGQAQGAYGIGVAADGTIWVATIGGAVISFDPKTERFGPSFEEPGNHSQFAGGTDVVPLASGIWLTTDLLDGAALRLHAANR